MAQAKIVQREVTPVVPATEAVVELVLTPEEARVILQLLSGTNGDCPQVSAIYAQLLDLDLPPKQYNMHGEPGMWSDGNTRASKGYNS